MGQCLPMTSVDVRVSCNDNFDGTSSKTIDGAMNIHNTSEYMCCDSVHMIMVRHSLESITVCAIANAHLPA